MCVRFNLRVSRVDLEFFFRTVESPEPITRFNIAATQDVLIVRADEQGARRASYVEWGLIPSAAADPSIGTRFTVAPAESVPTSPQLKPALKKRRCLVVASGFYDSAAGWQSGANAVHIYNRDRTPMAFAGIWDTWKSPAGSLIETCAILTTPPNSGLAPVCRRMPAILPEAAFDEWLNPKQTHLESLKRWLIPCPSSWIAYDFVGGRVIDPRHDDPECIVPDRRQAGTSGGAGGVRSKPPRKQKPQGWVSTAQTLTLPGESALSGSSWKVILPRSRRQP